MARDRAIKSRRSRGQEQKMRNEMDNLKMWNENKN